MRRRDFLMLAGCAASASGAALAQKEARATIGFLHSASPEGYETQLAAFHEGLRQQGFVEGQNLTVLYRWARDAVTELPALARNLVESRVAVIVAPGGDLSAQAAKGATSSIPVIFTIGGDPVRAGLVERINRPGGNVTGVTLFTIDLGPKRLELLRELLPTARMVALLSHPGYSSTGPGISDIDRGARMLSLETRILQATSASEIDHAFSELSKAKPDGLLIVSNPIFSARRKQIVAHAARYAIPAVYPLIDYTHDGGLMSYGSNTRTGYRETGVITGRILKGEKASEYPVMQPPDYPGISSVPPQRLAMSGSSVIGRPSCRATRCSSRRG